MRELQGEAGWSTEPGVFPLRFQVPAFSVPQRTEAN